MERATDQGRVYAAIAAFSARNTVLLDTIGALLLFAVSVLTMGYRVEYSWIVALQTMPLAFRRVAPMRVGLAVAGGCLVQAVVIETPLPSNVAVPIVLYTVASLAPDRLRSLGILALGFVGVVVATIRWNYASLAVDGTFSVGQAVFVGVALSLIVVPAWVLGDAVRNRRIVMRRLQEQNEALARDRDQRAALAAQAERTGIAREMHDIVAHSLAVVVVQADGAAYATRTALAASADQPTADAGASGRALAERAASTLETVADTAREALADTRRLVGVLRDGRTPEAEYAPTDGLAGLDALVERVRSSGIEVTLVIEGADEGDDAASIAVSVTREVDLAAYRIVQESLTNVLKHAGAHARAWVRLRCDDRLLGIEVIDDGGGLAPGAVPADGQGNGIIGMQERVAVLDGTLHAGPRHPSGFGVQATIPLTTR